MCHQGHTQLAAAHPPKSNCSNCSEISTSQQLLLLLPPQTCFKKTHTFCGVSEALQPPAWLLARPKENKTGRLHSPCGGQLSSSLHLPTPTGKVIWLRSPWGGRAGGWSGSACLSTHLWNVREAKWQLWSWRGGQGVHGGQLERLCSLFTCVWNRVLASLTFKKRGVHVSGFSCVYAECCPFHAATQVHMTPPPGPPLLLMNWYNRAAVPKFFSSWTRVFKRHSLGTHLALPD